MISRPPSPDAVERAARFLAPQNVVDLADWRRKKVSADATLPEPPIETAPSVAEAIEVCRNHPEILTCWEVGFLASIRYRPRLSPKQLTCLQRIYDKACGGRRP